MTTEPVSSTKEASSLHWHGSPSRIRAARRLQDVPGAERSGRSFYNEHDPKAAAWLRALIAEGAIPPGFVDERSITELKPHDLTGYSQHHFFAGIGGWPFALALACWPSTRPVWTGSCPCQPFSQAGKQLGGADERHLWPAWFRLIRECHPEFVFGEQVASAIGKGWLDGVSADLESEGYACGATVLGAHSVGGPHIRQRLFWVADSSDLRRAQHGRESRQRGAAGPHDSAERAGARGLDHAAGARCDGAISDTEGKAWNETRLGVPGAGCATGGLADMQRAGLEGLTGNGDDWNEPERNAEEQAGSTAESGGAWDGYELLPCRDGKARRIESGTFPLADGVPGRVGLLRGYGNAIVPEAAAQFVMAFCDVSLVRWAAGAGRGADSASDELKTQALNAGFSDAREKPL